MAGDTMKLKPRCINSPSQAVLVGVIAGSVMCSGLVPCTLAQNTQLVDYAPPAQLSHPHPSTNGTSVAETKIIPPAATTSIDRWMIFESEYGIQQGNPSAIGRMIQVAKYGLDRMTFTAQESAKK